MRCIRCVIIDGEQPLVVEIIVNMIINILQDEDLLMIDFTCYWCYIRSEVRYLFCQRKAFSSTSYIGLKKNMTMRHCLDH